MMSPIPPALMNVASVAVPTTMMSAVLMPASMIGTASGNSMRKRTAVLVMPIPRAASIVGRSTCLMPTIVLLMTGRKA